MSQRSFYIRACWDDDAKVYYSESDIIGLHIEADTLDEFEAILMESAVEMILTNHITPQEIATKPMRDLVPGILWQRPENEMACA